MFLVQGSYGAVGQQPSVVAQWPVEPKFLVRLEGRLLAVWSTEAHLVDSGLGAARITSENRH